MAQEHSSLAAYRQKWVGKRVRFTMQSLRGEGFKPENNESVYTGMVVGVGDDGARCDYDLRRKAKPNGILFVRLDDGREEDALEIGCTVI